MFVATRALTSKKLVASLASSAAPRSRWLAWCLADTSASPMQDRQPGCSTPSWCERICERGRHFRPTLPRTARFITEPLHLFATGVANRIVKADVASLYPSLMRQYRIGPKRDRLGVLLTLVDRLVDLRLAAKARAKRLPVGSPERHTEDAMSLAMKLVVNSAYGYLGAASLTRFADVHAANDVTRHGRALLSRMCRELALRGVTLLEADTDGVYFSMPPGSTEAHERTIVSEVAALLPEQVSLEFDGRYAAMLSHEPKNYALLPYGDAPLLLRGVAFRSSRTEPFGEDFLRRALTRLLEDDIAGVREAYVSTALALRRRSIDTHSVSNLVRLTKTPAQYVVARGLRREGPYEALLAAGRATWSLGERIRVYRATGGVPSLLANLDEEGESWSDPRDYDVDYYERLLVRTFASRLARALTADDFAAVFADPGQATLFPRSLADVHPILTELAVELSDGHLAVPGSNVGRSRFALAHHGRPTGRFDRHRFRF